MIGRGYEDSGRYILDIPLHSVLSVQQISAPEINDGNLSSMQLSHWHNRLDHPSLSALKRLFPYLVSSCNSVFHCAPCEYAKHCRTSYPISLNKSESTFDIVHSDVWGPTPTVSLFVFKYFVTFVDDYSRVP